MHLFFFRSSFLASYKYRIGGNCVVQSVVCVCVCIFHTTNNSQTKRQREKKTALKYQVDMQATISVIAVQFSFGFASAIFHINVIVCAKCVSVFCCCFRLFLYIRRAREQAFWCDFIYVFILKFELVSFFLFFYFNFVLSIYIYPTCAHFSSFLIVACVSLTLLYDSMYIIYMWLECESLPCIYCL